MDERLLYSDGFKGRVSRVALLCDRGGVATAIIIKAAYTPFARVETTLFAKDAPLRDGDGVSLGIGNQRVLLSWFHDGCQVAVVRGEQ